MVLGGEVPLSNPKENGREKPVLFGAANLRGGFAGENECSLEGAIPKGRLEQASVLCGRGNTDAATLRLC
jgi:hypothetical protein